MSRPYVIPLEDEDVEYIRKQYRIDLIPITDCMHCKYAEPNPREQSIHRYICKWHDMTVSGTYFCGSGERK